MDVDELKSEIEWLFNPELDEDGLFPREYPHDRLTRLYGLDPSYMNALAWEGSSMHKYTLLCSAADHDIHTLTRNSDVSIRLFEAGLRLFGDSILAYHGVKEPKGQLRFYPSVVLTFWSGFETFVRHASELMLVTVKEIPPAIANYLRDLEEFVDARGDMKTRTRYQAVLDRFAVLLRYGYRYQVDKGSRYWQRLEEAKSLRDYYTHLDVRSPRSISTQQVLEFMEAMLLGIIWPSMELQRTLLLGIFYQYDNWVRLSELAAPYVEQPFFKDWPMHEGYQFHCNFENVDLSRFPSADRRLR